MKKIMLLSMLSVFLFTETTNATELKSVTPPPTAVWVKLIINFHRPKMNCESGFGLCFDITMGVDDAMIRNGQNLCQVKAALNERNEFIVEVTSDVLNNYENGSTMPYFKDKRSITILDPYTLSATTCKALGSTTPLTIKPGNYPVSFANGVYTVAFQL